MSRATTSLRLAVRHYHQRRVTLSSSREKRRRRTQRNAVQTTENVNYNTSITMRRRRLTFAPSTFARTATMGYSTLSHESSRQTCSNIYQSISINSTFKPDSSLRLKTSKAPSKAHARDSKAQRHRSADASRAFVATASANVEDCVARASSAESRAGAGAGASHRVRCRMTR